MSETFLQQRAVVNQRQGGILELESPYPLRPCVTRSGDWLDHWATQTPGAIFLAERSGPGWRKLTYQDALDRVSALAASLLGLGLGPDKPLMLLSGKSVDHALLALAAQYVGIPSVALAEQYSLITSAHDKLQHATSLIKPGAVFVSSAKKYAVALNSSYLDGITVISADRGGHVVLQDLFKGDSEDIEVAKASVTLDSVAKLVFTSGSTSLPKAVRTTQRMLTVNQMQISQVWPFLSRVPQRIVDWLPWNHTFGGSHNFNLMLSNGGSLYLDDGSPTEEGISRSIENIRMVGQTVSFNVPIGYSMMAQAMRTDIDFRKAFFNDLNLIFYAAASMPQAIWDELKEHALVETGKTPEMSASWGMTETAPAALMVHGPMKRAGAIGVPLPGLKVKLMPLNEGLWELRVAGPNVTDGYHNAPEKTAETFDDEGYLISGDVVRFVDDENPDEGLFFDGRISEDFKLSTGTWVQASKVRTMAVSAMSDVVADLVICGQGRDSLAALAFVKPSVLDAMSDGRQTDGDGALNHPELLAVLSEGLKNFAQEGGGSSMRITRILALAEEPSLAVGEATHKGNLNQKLLLKTRIKWVERLYNDDDSVVIKLN